MRTLKDYPMTNYCPKLPDIWWIFTGKYALLDNFAPTQVLVDVGFGERYFQTGEHAYAAAKAGSRTDYLSIAVSQSPWLAKSRGRSCELRPDWEQIKFDVMWKVISAKFDQNIKARKMLLDTGTRSIMEGNTWEDRVWGATETAKVGVWSGRNALGRQLMELRTILAA